MSSPVDETQYFEGSREECLTEMQTNKPGTGDPLHTQEPVTVASFRTWRGWREDVAWGRCLTFSILASTASPNYCGSPILRTNSAYRGSERIESNPKSVGMLTRLASCSLYATFSHSKAWVLSSNSAYVCAIPYGETYSPPALRCARLTSSPLRNAAGHPPDRNPASSALAPSM